MVQILNHVQDLFLMSCIIVFKFFESTLILLPHTMKKQGKVGNIAEKSGSHLQERTFYQCYCARNYLSYSALYLHVKNKHNQNLSFKNFCRRRTHWSGSVKNVIL
jgi:hypothetical protein